MQTYSYERAAISSLKMRVEKLEAQVLEMEKSLLAARDFLHNYRFPGTVRID